MRGVWYHGAPGTGKTTRAVAATAGARGVYWYEGGSWDGFHDQVTHIIIDMITPDVISHRDLCRLLDPAPLSLRTDQGLVHRRATTVLVTSALRPEELYEEEANFTEHGAQQLARRFATVCTDPAPAEASDTPPSESDSDSSYTPTDDE